MWLLKYQEWNRWYFRVQSRENGETSIKQGPKLTKKISGVLKKIAQINKTRWTFLMPFCSRHFFKYSQIYFYQQICTASYTRPKKKLLIM